MVQIENNSQDAPPVPAPRRVYIFRVGKAVKKLPAGKDVEASLLKRLFSLPSEPGELTDSQGVSITTINITTGVDVFPSSGLEAGETYDIVESSAQVPPDFDLEGQERRVEVALWLCRALYEQDPVEFLRSPNVKNRHTFGDVCVGSQDGLKYMVAFTNDELPERSRKNRPQLPKQVYIAIRGTVDSHHLARNLKALPTIDRFRGRAHSGLLESAEKIPLELLINLINQHKAQRITICGHSAGGAIAHLYLLLFLLREASVPVLRECDIVSIAFGSPFSADEGVQAWLLQKPHHQRKFWTFAHNQDIFPRLSLNVIENIYGQKSTSPEILDQANQVVNSLEQVAAGAKFAGNLDTAYDSLKMLLDNPWIENNLQEIYTPFGWWIFCTRSEKGSHTDVNFEQNKTEIVELLGTTLLTRETIKNQGLSEYYGCLHRPEVLDFRQIWDTDRIVFRPMSDTPYPDIIDVCRSDRYNPTLQLVKAEIRVERIRSKLFSLFKSGRSQGRTNIKLIIDARGTNLEFMSSVQLENYYIDGTPLSLSLNSTAVDTTQPTLRVTTHFGVVLFPLQEKHFLRDMDPTLAKQFANEPIPLVLYKAIQRCYISLKNDGDGKRDILDAINELERAILGGSRIRGAIEHCFSENMDIENGLLYLEHHTWPLCENILNSIGKDLPINKNKGPAFYLLAAALIIGGLAVGGVAGAAVVEFTVEAGALIGASFGFVGAVGVDQTWHQRLLYRNERSYRLLVETLLEQLKMNDSASSMNIALDAPYLVEEALALKWKSLGYDTMDDDSIVADGPFRVEENDLFHNARPDSIKTAVQRIQWINLLHKIRKKMISNAFVSAIGPQNAGKTTALTKMFPGLWDLPNANTIEIGLKSHTRHITTYEFDNLTIVDFPGFNTINESDTSGPDTSLSPKLRNAMAKSCALASVILCFFPFEGSATTGLGELIDTVKHHIGQVPIIVCMNKACRSMDASDGLTSTEATDEWRRRLMAQLGLSVEEQSGIRLEFTDFESENADAASRGILDATMVRDIVVGEIKEKLLVVDKAEVEEMLKKATSRTTSVCGIKCSSSHAGRASQAHSHMINAGRLLLCDKQFAN
ncbi:hypothetical protein BC938DRAFT_484054 [Jimgerdemannia flammicorona]|uniref:Fungal lipase-type domain-containing protein n=1 Tax=Jimgerdemannia flammicorona TaxID=994334 RepID=A0A433QAL2_9FUNG|nr:hypothetical protein BC938DRAFT_484054 [Jimgerdemannia flammicorona]